MTGCKRLENLDGDVFEASVKQKTPKRKKTPFDASDDLKLFSYMPKAIRKHIYNAIPKECKQAARDSLVAGIILKKCFDSEYGENNYTFVSVGTSPAPVGRFFEFLGQDVKYIPVSNVGDIGFPASELTEYQDYRQYSKFLDSVGLTRKDILKSGKTHIFCDYTSTGATLDAVRHFALNSRALPKNRVDFKSLNRELMGYASNNPEVYSEVKNYVIDLYESNLSKYSGVPHLHCMLVNEIDEKLKEPKGKDAKNFDFAMAYMMDRENILAR